MISVVEYNPGWPQRFGELRREYAEAMAAAGVPVLAIDHVGSTSVPGLAAKPIIDCDIVVAGPDVAATSQALVRLGFTPLGELGAVAADIDGYGRGKNAMVQQILAAAGFTEEERASIDANQVPSHDEVPR